MTDQTFHFTLGPVQGFVAQARRTRDFWAGSFLLSWLAGAAMQAVTQQGGKIDFPTPDKTYLDWLTGAKSGADGPRQGCIPNRFKAVQCKVPDNFQPEYVEQTVRAAWAALAEAVWQRDLQPHHPHTETRAIWERQIKGFWEISWALGSGNSLLDQRKNRRSHLPPIESGVKCSMMAGWQELSGAAHPGDRQLEQFWTPIRNRYPSDFADQEQLCAIAFIKRRFVAAFATLRAPMSDARWTLHGWPLKGQMPSTLDLAAAHWVERLSNAEPLQTAIDALVATSPQLGRSDRGLGLLRCVREHTNQQLAQLHSSALFAHVLENQGICPDRTAVKAVKQLIKEQQHGEPSPFYAILLMDGDSLGKLLQSDLNAPPKISQALNAFTACVPELVDQHHGFLIYAGGDDVLALLPLDDALGCAAAIRVAYLAAFKQAFGKDGCSTISAAVTFAHVKIPLTRVLRDSHHLLDNLAKEATGRDALAVRVLKPSGEALQWARPWECAINPAQSGQLVIERLAQDFAVQERAAGERTFSGKFFYRIRERFQFINPPKDQPDVEPVFDQAQAVSLLAVDYLASGVNDGRRNTLTLAEAERLITPLLDQCRPVKRELHDDQPMFTKSQRFDPDGALLVRFLAQKGVETR
ncbi:CRISPR-associated protein Cmr2 [Allochromatium warmingii]|uniref:CRISPR-associated protein Cmr2 n=1 Tax=Allochromatium warmingii TaxID=61595 RepID=A0A1H3BV67_ALLWA|nr:type III-B CRISPR-associated protein Cas10/Cmr2 [Allochromatium warmingii]SDX45518.1 CRISPR-associated protein Cmr2 [Allochromatium warmingii]